MVERFVIFCRMSLGRCRMSVNVIKTSDPFLLEKIFSDSHHLLVFWFLLTSWFLLMVKWIFLLFSLTQMNAPNVNHAADTVAIMPKTHTITNKVRC